jgi:hypothetical protein
MKSLKMLVDHLFDMEKTTTNMTVVLTLAFGLILGSIGSASLAHAQQQANTTATGSNMTGKAAGPGTATNATKSPSSVGGGNMTSPTNAKAANETASTQSGGNKSMAGGGSTAGSGNATQSGNQTMTAAKQQSANQTGNNTGNPLAKIPIIGKIFGGK